MSESTTPRRYGLKHAVVVEVWELHEQALRDALMEKARRLSTEGGYAQPPDDLEIDVIPRRRAGRADQAEVLEACPMKEAQLVELRVKWHDPAPPLAE